MSVSSRLVKIKGFLGSYSNHFLFITMALVDYGFTPASMRTFLLQFIQPNIGTMTYPNGQTDLAITIGNMSTNDLTIKGIEVNIPLFPNTEELSFVDADTASYKTYWELGFYLWDDSDDGRLKLYEILSVLTRKLPGVRIYRCSAGIANGFEYSECYTVVTCITCTSPKEKI